MLEDPNIASLLIQIPIVGAFIWFSISLVDRFLLAQKAVADEFSKTVERLSTTFIELSRKRELELQEFFDTRRTTESEEMKKLSDEMSKLSLLIHTNSLVIARHDAKNDGLMDELLGLILEKRSGAKRTKESKEPPQNPS